MKMTTSNILGLLLIIGTGAFLIWQVVGLVKDIIEKRKAKNLPKDGDD